jgi:hypothetical protein
LNDKTVIRKTLTPQEASQIYGLDVRTLANYRYQKRGPQYFKCGRKVLYRVEHIEEWILRNPVLTIDSIEV